ncbi:hypothetical protein M514_16419 [Trichuris suis]|uniref:Uncharacterized protein n=1 Tax=Trichuris suis TaxID=68888 RepID=A0A085NPU1_9BILA|nr:hypothetical protein M514_16419 [Trichuris suis]
MVNARENGDDSLHGKVVDNVDCDESTAKRKHSVQNRAGGKRRPQRTRQAHTAQRTYAAHRHTQRGQQQQQQQAGRQAGEHNALRVQSIGAYQHT